LCKYHIIRAFIVAVQNYRQKKYYQWAGEADEFQRRYQSVNSPAYTAAIVVVRVVKIVIITNINDNTVFVIFNAAF
jgi:hypothetical protein